MTTRHYWRLTPEQRRAYDEVDQDERAQVDQSLEQGYFERSDGRRLALEIAKMVNGDEADQIRWFVQAMAGEHRTLQQAFTRLCVAWFQDLAKKYEDGKYDARNEASCSLAVKIMELGTHLPLV